MKIFQIVFLSMALAAISLFVSSFTSNGYNANAFARVCYSYSPPASSPPVPASPHKKNTRGETESIIRSQLIATGNWNLVSPTPAGTPSECNTGDYLCAVCYDDAVYSLADIMDILADWYDTHDSPIFPHNMDIDPSANVVTTYLKSTNTDAIP